MNAWRLVLVALKQNQTGIVTGGGMKQQLAMAQLHATHEPKSSRFLRWGGRVRYCCHYLYFFFSDFQALIDRGESFRANYLKERKTVAPLCGLGLSLKILSLWEFFNCAKNHKLNIKMEGHIHFWAIIFGRGLPTKCHRFVVTHRKITEINDLVRVWTMNFAVSGCRKKTCDKNLTALVMRLGFFNATFISSHLYPSPLKNCENDKTMKNTCYAVFQKSSPFSNLDRKNWQKKCAWLPIWFCRLSTDRFVTKTLLKNWRL